ncbi:MAG TPA: hypothetical protein VK425_02060 [Acidimicrobiales bacterium]|nr:hypothetical protein [Acidimicrobiales bacterium]
MSFTSAAHPLRTSRLLRLRRALQRLCGRLQDQRASQITDNLGLIVIGIVAIVAIGGLISGLDTTIFTWVSKQLGLS